MQKLRKQDRHRFDDICQKIRDALHLAHLDWEYRYQSEANRNIASTQVFSHGWRLLIYIYPRFWELDFKDQIRVLLHEHIHVCLHPYHQAVDGIENEWVSPHCRSQVEEKNQIAGEIVVDHLESVLYDLLKDRF